jgi:adenosylmethionine-8-amino-7-oxononanoate aminotransferase
MGDYLLDGLNGLRDHPSVGDVRGIGLLAGMELVEDKENREKFPSDAIEHLNAGLLKRGLLTRASHIVSLSPPLCITRAEIDRIVAILDDSIGDMERAFGLG